MRRMYDAIRANAHVLVGKVEPDDLLAIYLTGSPDIRWTSTEVALFPHVKTFVRIDQGGQTSPQFAANVVDVEPFAWTVANAQASISKFRTPQTIYCDRSDFARVTAKVPIWLAAPGLSDAQAIALAKTDSRIVAVQNVFAGTYDSSIVVNDSWMAAAPPPPPPVKNYEFQVEWWKPGFGWVLEPTIVTTPAQKYRVRSNNGVRWSDWTEIQP